MTRADRRSVIRRDVYCAPAIIAIAVTSAHREVRRREAADIDDPQSQQLASRLFGIRCNEPNRITLEQCLNALNAPSPSFPIITLAVRSAMSLLWTHVPRVAIACAMLVPTRDPPHIPTGPSDRARSRRNID